MQWYVNVPVWLNVCWNVWAAAAEYPPVPAGGVRPPEFQIPASLVVLCSDGPSFTHWTVVPTLIVSTAGENLKSCTMMLTPLAGAGGLVMPLELPPHDNAAAAIATIMN
jgi:hypothetical protein